MISIRLHIIKLQIDLEIPLFSKLGILMLLH